MFIVKNILIKSSKYDAANPKYNKPTVDRLPIIKQPEKLDYKQLSAIVVVLLTYTFKTIMAAVVSFCVRRSADLGLTRAKKISKSVLRSIENLYKDYKKSR